MKYKQYFFCNCRTLLKLPGLIKIPKVKILIRLTFMVYMYIPIFATHFEQCVTKFSDKRTPENIANVNDA